MPDILRISHCVFALPVFLASLPFFFLRSFCPVAAAFAAASSSAAFAAAADCDVLLSVGTSGVVYPAAQVPEIALHSGAAVVHVNPEPQAFGGQHEWLLAGAAGEVLPLLVQVTFDE